MAESFGASDGNTTKRKGSRIHSSTKASRRRKSVSSYQSLKAQTESAFASGLVPF